MHATDAGLEVIGLMGVALSPNRRRLAPASPCFDASLIDSISTSARWG